MAFLFAAETATRIATESLHLHGGLGFTLDCDIQLFFRRAKGWPLVLGDPRVQWLELPKADFTTDRSSAPVAADGLRPRRGW